MWILSKSIYQMRIPVFITSFLLGFYLLQYFTGIKELTSWKGSTDLFASIVVGIISFFAVFLGVTNQIRQLSRQWKEPLSKKKGGNMIILGTFALFSLVAIFQGQSSTLYQLLYQYIPGYVTFNGLSGYYDLYLMLRLIRFDDIYIVFYYLVVVARFLRDITVVSYYFTPIFSLMEWFKFVPHTASYMGTQFAAGIGLVILGIRALVGKEPGLIELEKV